MFLMHYLIYWFNISTGNQYLMQVHAMFNSLKSGLIHLTGQPNSQQGRSAKVKDGIISETKFLGTLSVDTYLPATNTLAY
jgi:hypothetical protein